MPNLDAFFFYVFSALALLGGIFTVTRRSPVHSAIALAVSLLGVAGLFLLQKAEFLFAVQIIVYIGGITLLFLFVIMLVNLEQVARERQFSSQWPLALACVVGIGAVGTAFVLKGGEVLPFDRPITAAVAAGNTEQIADILFSSYLLPFEIASVLLLIAIVGSVFLARPKA
ncbi:MAG TPA: NADH-quinone oxidoreductase subunit J [Bryobacteraceae bacterium]|nr:NADH-quinone oxidoreductase subunit J [Bryobacteraceae bacterium]